MIHSADTHVSEVARGLIAALDEASGGKHAGFRANHARGILLSGSFTPSPTAAALSSAPHFSAGKSTPIIARFSSSSGIPTIPDTDTDAQPLGLAVRFNLPSGAHTDIIAHNVDCFPTRTGEELVHFFEAKLAGSAALESFVATRPAARAFLDALRKPAPVSFATTSYFALIAYKFVAASGASCFARYTFVPKAGEQHPAPETNHARGPNFLYEELTARLESGDAITFELWAQIAEDGDVTDDITARWPEERKRVLLGTLVFGTLVDHNIDAQRRIAFDPVPRVNGIEPSADRLLEVRSTVYQISSARRREAVLRSSGGT